MDDTALFMLSYVITAAITLVITLLVIEFATNKLAEPRVTIPARRITVPLMTSHDQLDRQVQTDAMWQRFLNTPLPNQTTTPGDAIRSGTATVHRAGNDTWYIGSTPNNVTVSPPRGYGWEAVLPQPGVHPAANDWITYTNDVRMLPASNVMGNFTSNLSEPEEEIVEGPMTKVKRRVIRG